MSSSGPSATSTGIPSGTPGANLQEIVANQWLRVLCKKPQATWLRRFGAISGSAPSTSRDRRTCNHLSGPGSRPATTSTPETKTKSSGAPAHAFEQSGAGTGSKKDSRGSIIAKIAIAAFFFAMRSCKITAMATPWRTKIMCLKGIVFRDSRHREIPHSPRHKLQLARRVTVTFENQKNGLKWTSKRMREMGTMSCALSGVCPPSYYKSWTTPRTLVRTPQSARYWSLGEPGSSPAANCDGVIDRRAQREGEPAPSGTVRVRSGRDQSDHEPPGV